MSNSPKPLTREIVEYYLHKVQCRKRREKITKSRTHLVAINITVKVELYWTIVARLQRFVFIQKLLFIINRKIQNYKNTVKQVQVAIEEC